MRRSQSKHAPNLPACPRFTSRDDVVSTTHATFRPSFPSNRSKPSDALRVSLGNGRILCTVITKGEKESSRQRHNMRPRRPGLPHAGRQGGQQTLPSDSQLGTEQIAPDTGDGSHQQKRAYPFLGLSLVPQGSSDFASSSSCLPPKIHRHGLSQRVWLLMLVLRFSGQVP